jgi:hypothetical protein
VTPDLLHADTDARLGTEVGCDLRVGAALGVAVRGG